MVHACVPRDGDAYVSHGVHDDVLGVDRSGALLCVRICAHGRVYDNDPRGGRACDLHGDHDGDPQDVHTCGHVRVCGDDPRDACDDGPRGVHVCGRVHACDDDLHDSHDDVRYHVR